MFQIVHNLDKFLFDLVHSGYVFECHATAFTGMELGSAPPELHGLVAPALKLVHDEEEHSKEQHYRYYVGYERYPPGPLRLRNHAYFHARRELRVIANILDQALHVGVVQLELPPIVQSAPDCVFADDLELRDLPVLPVLHELAGRDLVGAGLPHEEGV